MLYCTECGTQNRDGSKFCNNCGARLTVPAAAVPPKPAAPAQPPPVEPPATPPVPTVPAWMEGIDPAEAASAGEATPDWLARLRSQPPEIEEASLVPDEDASNLPDWIAEMSAQDAVQASSPDESETGWVAQLRAKVESAGEPPATLQGLEEPNWAPLTETVEAQPAPVHTEAEAEQKQPSQAPAPTAAIEMPAPTAGVKAPGPTATIDVLAPSEAIEASAPTVAEVPAPTAAIDAPAPIEATASPAPIEATASPAPTAVIGAPASTAAIEEPAPAAAIEPPAPIATNEVPEPTVAAEAPVPTAPIEIPAPIAAVEESVPNIAIEEMSAAVKGESAPTVELEKAPDQVPAPIVPAWIEELSTESLAEVSEEPSHVEPVSVPPQAETAAVQPQPPAAPAEPSGPAPDQEMPDWLKALRASASSEPEVEKESPTLESVEPLAGPVVEELPAFSLEESGVPPEGDGLPDWLTGAAQVEPLPGAVTGAATVESPAEPSEEPSPFELPAGPAEALPDWIAALKPAELGAPVGPAVEPEEVSGPLAGLHGILPLANAVTQAHAPLKAAAEKMDRRDAARLFDSILAEPAGEEMPVTAGKASRVWTMRPVVYLLLALAVLIPFVLPGVFGTVAVRIVNTPAAQFYDLVQAVPADRVVVLAFDYDPSVAGEMNLQAGAIVRDLVARRTKLVVLSTLETGPALAEPILQSAVGEANDHYVYGTDYIHLGYVPGHEAGLAQLATQGLPAGGKDYATHQALASYPLTAGFQWSQVQLVIVLAGSEDPLRLWIEQFRPRLNIQMVAGVSAAAEPQARVYQEAGQLSAELSGLLGAAQYETLSNRAGRAVTSWNAQGAAQLALVLIILLGNVVFWISRARTRNHE